MNLMDMLKKKIGPAPVWVYGIAGVLLLAWWWSKKKSTDTTDSNAADTATTANAYPMSYSNDWYVTQSVPQSSSVANKTKPLTVRTGPLTRLLNPVTPLPRRTTVTTGVSRSSLAVVQRMQEQGGVVRAGARLVIPAS